eukprot:362458-Chlamydomonas_euryale.AAC.4
MADRPPTLKRPHHDQRAPLCAHRQSSRLDCRRVSRHTHARSFCLSLSGGEACAGTGAARCPLRLGRLNVRRCLRWV